MNSAALLNGRLWQDWYMSERSHLQLHVKLGLGKGEDADGRFRLAQLVVDADERLHSSVGAGRVLQLLVVQRLGERMALLRQSAQRPAHKVAGNDMSWTAAVYPV